MIIFGVIYTVLGVLYMYTQLTHEDYGWAWEHTRKTSPFRYTLCLLFGVIAWPIWLFKT